jgi:hypothetical protein
MQWNGGAKDAAPFALVGKGVVFDTGGISIKPAGGMEDMTMDMGGAGVVAGVMRTLALRKAKHAPVTPTVLDGAVGEAAKAGMSLEAFLRIWCRRGTQGLEADWLKSSERGQGASQPAEPAWRTEQRERTAAFAGPAAAKPRTTATVIDMEHAYGTARRLD